MVKLGNPKNIPGNENKKAQELNPLIKSRATIFERAQSLFNDGEAQFLVADSKAYKEGVGFSKSTSILSCSRPPITRRTNSF